MNFSNVLPHKQSGGITMKTIQLQHPLLQATWLVPGFLIAALHLLAVDSPDATASTTAVHATTDPEIEMWFYPVSSANGVGSVRDRASTFSWFSPQEGFPDITGSGHDPARRGTFIVATETAGSIPLLADPARYRIDSVKVTLTMMGNIGDGAGPYDNTPDDISQVLAHEGDDPGNPVEMYGVGFDGDYTTFGFHGETAPEYFNSGDRRWPISAGSFSGPYQIYPVDTNGHDVSNNMVNGGYSATAAGNVNSIFNASPYAVGKTYDELGVEIAPGTAIGQGTTLEFEPDLTNPSIVSYIQNSLAAGHLGFFFSSLHEPAGHDGTVFYPDFYFDNNPSGPNPYGAGPTMAIEVTILDDLLAGDYDGSGVVDGGDFLAWQRQYGSVASPTGSGADGDGSGVMDAGDLDVWKLHFGNGSAGNTGVSAAVPEPHSAALLITGLAALGFGRPNRRTRTQPSR